MTKKPMRRKLGLGIALVAVALVFSAAIAMSVRPVSLFNLAAQALNTCVIGGCSGEMCRDIRDENMATTCEVRPEYACFKQYSRCDRTNGVCGWVQTPALVSCIANPPPMDGAPSAI
jgi:eight-cysteine-cluster-containing protein